MILLGQIQTVKRNEMKDKTDASKAPAVMFLVVVMDKTKPVQCRTGTPFCTFIMEERFRAMFGPNDYDAVDQDVTCVLEEIGSYNSMVKFKGQFMKGHLTTEDLNRLANPSKELPTKPTKPTV